MKVLIVISTAASLLMIGVGVIVALLPALMLQQSSSLQGVGLLASAFALSYLAIQLPVGYLADRLGVKWFLIIGYLLTAFSGAIFLTAHSPEALYFGRFMQGAGEAPIWALGPAMLSLAYPLNKGKVIGIYNASIHLGLTIGPLLGLFLVSTYDSTMPFQLFIVLCLLGGLLIALFLPDRNTSPMLVAESRPAMTEFIQLLHKREPMIALVGIVIYGAGYGVCISVLPATLAIDKGFDPVSNSVYFTLFYLSISVSQLIIGPLSDRHGRLNFMLIGMILSGIGFVSFSLFVYPWIYAPLAIASIGLGVFCVSSMAFLSECIPATLRSTISGSYYLAWGIGYFLGPLLISEFTAGYEILVILIFIEAYFIHKIN